jgi:hypothetical protein
LLCLISCCAKPEGEGQFKSRCNEIDDRQSALGQDEEDGTEKKKERRRTKGAVIYDSHGTAGVQAATIAASAPRPLVAPDMSNTCRRQEEGIACSLTVSFTSLCLAGACDNQQTNPVLRINTMMAEVVLITSACSPMAEG